MRKIIVFSVIFIMSFSGFSQETIENEKSNIQKYTPSKLLNKGQWDIKWFNNFYTQTESTFSESSIPRENFYTSTFEVYTGVSENSRINIGVVFNIRSSTLSSIDEEQGWFSPIKFKNEDGVSRAGLTNIAPSISFQPFKNVGNFSIRSLFFIPLIDNETENGVFLDKNSYTWENKFFYDYTFPSGKFQLFTELDTQFHFGDKEDGYANNSLGVPMSVFLSYFPVNNFTVYLQTQQFFLIDLGNDFSQDYTQLGLGFKYQVNKVLNLETSYTNFVRGTYTGLGQTLNFGVRTIF